MKKLIVVILITGLFSISLGAQSNFKINVLQFLGGLAGQGCCLVPAYLLLRYSDWNGPLAWFSIAGLYLAAPLASATGVRLVGDHYYNKPEQGSYGYSLLGAYLVGVTMIGVMVAAKIEGFTIPIAAIPAINIGAIVGYHLSRHKTAQHSFFYDHLQSPSLGLKLEKDEKGKTIAAFDIRLLNARF
jgi:hypothetical protein